MTLRAALASVKRVRAGEGVSYGHVYTTDARHDARARPAGLRRRHPAARDQRRAGVDQRAALHGQRPGLHGPVRRRRRRSATSPSSDEAILFGAGPDEPRAQDWADAIGTIHYEIVTRIGPRVPRTYRGGDGVKRGGIVGGCRRRGVPRSARGRRRRPAGCAPPGAGRRSTSSPRPSRTAPASCARPTACGCTTSRTARSTPPLTVVLVHGFCQNRDDLLFQRRALVDEFGDRVRVVSFDLRSHGRSSRSDPDARHHRPARRRSGPGAAPSSCRRGPRRAHRSLDGRHDDPRARRRAARAVPRPGRRRRADQHVDRQARLAHPRRAGRPGARSATPRCGSRCAVCSRAAASSSVAARG